MTIFTVICDAGGIAMIYIWVVPSKKALMVKIFKIDFLIKNDRLQFKLTEYEIWAWYRAYLMRYRLSIRKENWTIGWKNWRFKWRDDQSNDVKMTHRWLEWLCNCTNDISVFLVKFLTRNISYEVWNLF